jgi:hypothetical protein
MPKLSKEQYSKYETLIVREALEWSIQELSKKASSTAYAFVQKIAAFAANALKIFKKIRVAVEKAASRLKQVGQIRPESAGKTVQIIDPAQFNRIITTAMKNFEQAQYEANNAISGRQCNDADEPAEVALDRIDWKIGIVPDVATPLLHLLKRAESADFTISKLRQALNELQKLSSTDDNQSEAIQAKMKHITDCIKQSCSCLMLAMRQTFAVAHSFVIAVNARADASLHT